MEHLVVVLGLAVVDAINPTTLAITLYLLLHRNYLHKVSVFVAGIFITYFLFGLALEIGLAEFLLNAWGDQHPAILILNYAIGTAMILYGLSLKNRPPKRRSTLREKSVVTLPSAFALGGLATLMDLPTAFPYLGAISLMGRAHLGQETVVGILLLYNAIVVLPQAVLLGLRLATHHHAEAVMKHLRRVVLKWEIPVLRTLLIVGGALFIVSVVRSGL